MREKCSPSPPVQLHGLFAERLVQEQQRVLAAEEPFDRLGLGDAAIDNLRKGPGGDEARRTVFHQDLSVLDGARAGDHWPASRPECLQTFLAREVREPIVFRKEVEPAQVGCDLCGLRHPAESLDNLGAPGVGPNVHRQLFAQGILLFIDRLVRRQHWLLVTARDNPDNAHAFVDLFSVVEKKEPDRTKPGAHRCNDAVRRAFHVQRVSFARNRLRLPVLELVTVVVALKDFPLDDVKPRSVEHRGIEPDRQALCTARNITPVLCFPAIDLRKLTDRQVLDGIGGVDHNIHRKDPEWVLGQFLRGPKGLLEPVIVRHAPRAFVDPDITSTVCENFRHLVSVGDTGPQQLVALPIDETRLENANQGRPRPGGHHDRGLVRTVDLLRSSKGMRHTKRRESKARAHNRKARAASPPEVDPGPFHRQPSRRLRLRFRPLAVAPAIRSDFEYLLSLIASHRRSVPLT